MTITEEWAPPPKGIRERFTTTVKKLEPIRAGVWHGAEISVFDNELNVPVGSYRRNYPTRIPGFEPFWQDGKPYALMSRDYMYSACMDLTTGEVIAEEAEEAAWSYYTDSKTGEEKIYKGAGFCPIDFYAPGFWDLHDGSILPGSKHWKPYMADDASSTWALVSGCLWGDDDDWKIQYLDLSKITEGLIIRDERFGYVPLADSKADLRDVIDVWDREDGSRIHIPVRVSFDLNTGIASRHTIDDINFGGEDDTRSPQRRRS